MLEKLYTDYGNRAEFLTIYIKEAHPTDEWHMKVNEKEDVCYAQPKTLQNRVAIANDFKQRFQYKLPLLVDPMENGANAAFAAWPERLYIIDPKGRIAYKGKTGPFGYKPQEVGDWLQKRFKT